MGRFTSGKRPGTYCGPQGRSGRVRKNSPLLEFEPHSVRPVSSRCTDWAIPASCSLWIDPIKDTIFFQNNLFAMNVKLKCSCLCNSLQTQWKSLYFEYLNETIVKKFSAVIEPTFGSRLYKGQSS